jgi:DNA polymerase elongation subunit (family B)
MGKYYNIDPETCSIEELKEAIAVCKNKAEFYDACQLGVKLFLNSVYGAMAAGAYVCNNLDIAESITLQGQDLIKYSANVINQYFRTKWHLDTEVHNNIANAMKEQFPDFDIEKFKKLAATPLPNFETLQVYGDTDSAYISLQLIVEQCQIGLDQQTAFILALNDYMLDSYLNNQFEVYAQEWNCPENKEKFELEKIARLLLMQAKKKYVMDIAWTDDGTFHKPLHKINYKGIEVVQGSTPDFCRTEMKNFIKYILQELNEGRHLVYGNLVQKLKEIKARFAMQSPNNVSKSFKISDYEKYVLNDKGKIIEFTEATCPFHVRGAAVYNNLLYNDAKKYKSKYSFIKKGDKIKFYYTKGGGVFSFIPDSFPLEFAPKMDVDEQFTKMILDPLNRIISIVGFAEVPKNLTYSSGLF